MENEICKTLYCHYESISSKSNICKINLFFTLSFLICSPIFHFYRKNFFPGGKIFLKTRLIIHFIPYYSV
ncbi:hypothetical protein D2M30_2006 [Bacillus amyloliquefaciens]|nr:hypothetical protein D2M30_2006 [Bacillus amyloliquefaciens]